MSKFQKERRVEIIIGQTSKNNKKEKDKNKEKKSKYSLYQLFH